MPCEPITDLPVQDRLVRTRLGPYAGLYYALRAKHPPAAAHCLRVAVGCSKWAGFCNLSDAARELLEVAGLVHDVGRMGVPDAILQKPAPLVREEQLSMELTLSSGLEMLSAVGASPAAKQTIEIARQPFEACPASHPLASMLKIVDAFDSMTSTQIFRSAMSRERAIDELFANAGTQFGRVGASFCGVTWPAPTRTGRTAGASLAEESSGRTQVAFRGTGATLQGPSDR